MENKEIVLKIDGKETYRGDNGKIALTLFAAGIADMSRSFEEALDTLDVLVKSVELFAEGKRVFYTVGVENVADEK